MDPNIRTGKPAGRSTPIPVQSPPWPASALGILFFGLVGLAPINAQSASSLQLHSSSFSNAAEIAPRYTCDGGDVSPNLQWTRSPAGTKSIAIVMLDPDAPEDFTHWLVYNIPPTSGGVPENASLKSAMPAGSEEGINDFGRVGYGGPCPPPGNPHHYVFHVYALDIRLDLRAARKRTEFDSAIKGHVIAEGQTVALYRRPNR